MEENSTDFEEFASAFSGDGYQTGETENTETADTTQQSEEEPDHDIPDSAEETKSEETETPSDQASQEGKDEGASQEPPPEQKFTIKVNKESREVGLSEMTELAQKGADYDRVKGQLSQARQ